MAEKWKRGRNREREEKVEKECQKNSLILFQIRRAVVVALGIVEGSFCILLRHKRGHFSPIKKLLAPFGLFSMTHLICGRKRAMTDVGTREKGIPLRWLSRARCGGDVTLMW